MSRIAISSILMILTQINLIHCRAIRSDYEESIGTLK